MDRLKKGNKMKKGFLLLTILLCGAPSARAATLGVENLTSRSISVAVEGSQKHYNSLNALTIKPGKAGNFEHPFKKISGPLRFAFTEDMKKNKYHFYETYSKKNVGYVRATTKKEKNDFVRNYVLSILPLRVTGIKGVQIKMNNDNVPFIRQSQTFGDLLFRKHHPWKKLKEKIAKRRTDGKPEW